MTDGVGTVHGSDRNSKEGRTPRVLITNGFGRPQTIVGGESDLISEESSSIVKYTKKGREYLELRHLPHEILVDNLFRTDLKGWSFIMST